MPAKKAPPWTSEEIAVLNEIYPIEGLNGVTDLLPERSWQAIYVMANKLGLKAAITQKAPTCALSGDRLKTAIKLRDVDGWSFARIAASIGNASEAGVSNAYYLAKAPAPMKRDHLGRILPSEIERLRLMLKRGIKPIEIQKHTGLSAGRIAEERRRYNADLMARDKAPLPPPGGGEAYSGAKVPIAKKREVEQLFMEGLGTLKVSQRTGVSKTVCTRTRAKLVKRLRRKGECLPGCDINGTRHVQADSIRFIPDGAKEQLRAKLLAGVPCIRAARMLGIGGSSAYRIRDALIAELQAIGERLPYVHEWRGKSRQAEAAVLAVPGGEKNIYRYRALCREMPTDQARATLLAELGQAEADDRARRQAEAARPKSFEEKLAAIAQGKGRLVPVFKPSRAAPDMTLGGISTGMI